MFSIKMEISRRTSNRQLIGVHEQQNAILPVAGKALAAMDPGSAGFFVDEFADSGKILPTLSLDAPLMTPPPVAIAYRSRADEHSDIW